MMAFTLATDSTGVHTDSIEATRAVDGLNNNSTFLFPADFTVAVDGVNYTYTAISANTNMTSSSPANYPLDNSHVRIQAFYPSYMMQYAASPQTFTVSQDQCQTSLGGANYRASDLMYGLPKGDFTHLDGSGLVIPTEDAVPLVFEHKMVKIRIDITTNGATVKCVTMKNVRRSIDFNTADATFSNLATAADGFGDNVIMYNHATGTNTNFTCTALIPKQNLAVNTPFIDIVVDAQPSDLTMTYSLNDVAIFNPGMQYIFNLSVSMDEVDGLSCEIADWNDAPDDPEFTQIKTL